MKKFGEYLEESLAAEIKTEPTSAAAAQARKMGLQYMGFGRYANSKGQLTYIVDKGKLVPYKSQEEVQGMYQKAHSMPQATDKKTKDGKPVEDKSKTLLAQADEHNRVMTKRYNQDRKIMDKKKREAAKNDKILQKAFPASMFDENELAALQAYTMNDFTYVNRYLYKGHDEGVTQEDADNIDSIIQGMDSAFADAKVPMSYTVYSGLSERYTPDSFSPGETFVFRGYVSTSLDYDTAIEGFTEQNESSVVLQIEVTKGQSAIHVSGFSQVNQDDLYGDGMETNEMETILPRGSKIQIISGPHVVMTNAINQDGYGGEYPINIFHCALVQDS